MITRLVLLALLIPSVAFAQAPAVNTDAANDEPRYPHRGMFRSSDQNTMVSYECKYDAQLSCTFIETSLRKVAEPNDWVKKMPQLLELMPSLQKDLEHECAPDTVKNNIAVIKGEKTPETYNEKDIAANIRELDASERLKYAETVAKACETRDLSALTREAFERGQRTCIVSSRTYTLQFQAGAKKELLWLSKGTPDEECGTTMNASLQGSLDKDGYPANWTLEVKRLKAAGKKPLFFSQNRCEALAGERVFTLQSDVKTRHHCEYLIFQR